MPRILNFGGVAGLSSMFSLAIRILSLYWSAISSRIGAIILQGPHHSAQKSSNTGLSAFRTSSANLASEVCTMCSLVTQLSLLRAKLLGIQWKGIFRIGKGIVYMEIIT